MKFAFKFHRSRASEICGLFSPHHPRRAIGMKNSSNQSMPLQGGAPQFVGLKTKLTLYIIVYIYITYYIYTLHIIYIHYILYIYTLPIIYIYYNYIYIYITYYAFLNMHHKS